ncbi:unnamed protein product [Diabrotica balteata]|uniref:Uncharacterized protein n=1 Tax=Diabrotica balteata TaxID=107213 RepID=A0A9N9TCK2_DIABA|nr:unnamed protein product [Diabrotica balteata]
MATAFQTRLTERYAVSQLHRSTNNIEACSNDKPDDKTEIEIKAEIKKELAQDEQGYNIESQLTTSLDLGNLKNEPDEDNSEIIIHHYHEGKTICEISSELTVATTTVFNLINKYGETASIDVGIKSPGPPKAVSQSVDNSNM